MDFVIKQNSELPILEIRPIITPNFKYLIQLIKTAVVTFSMYDKYNYPIVLNKDCVINLYTKTNNYNAQDDSSEDIRDFTIQYHFNKKDTAKLGIYRGEFKIKFINDSEEKNLILNTLDIEIVKSNIKTNTIITNKIVESIETMFDLILIGNNEYISTNDNFYIKFL